MRRACTSRLSAPVILTVIDKQWQIIHMRRSDKEITDKSAIEAIIHKSLVCRLALSDGAKPYVVPLCFGYDDNCLYFHSAPEGRKIDMIRANSSVCFEFDANAEIVEGEEACYWGMRYQSVIGFGKAFLVEDIEEKRTALGIIMSHYSAPSLSFPEDVLRHIAVIRVEIESMTGKQSGY